MPTAVFRRSEGEVAVAGRVQGKTAFVSGGAQGLGAYMVRGLLAQGARVVFGDILEEQGCILEAELHARGFGCAFVRLDVTREDGWSEALARAQELFGSVDILVNNAGIVLKREPVEAIAGEDWDRLMAVNVKGVFLGIKQVIPLMRRQGGGSIINVSSLAAIGQAEIQEPAYAASKAAVARFTKVVAAQHAHENIRCNSLHPGPVDGGMLRHSFAPDPLALAKRLTRVPMGRLGTIEEIVAGVTFLASDESSFMTGSELVIDGGCAVQ
jgi:NAD(P)-dependent dehydrogenase (short-subunit alcohol dehydrogenase family)